MDIRETATSLLGGRLSRGLERTVWRAGCIAKRSLHVTTVSLRLPRPRLQTRARTGLSVSAIGRLAYGLPFCSDAIHHIDNGSDPVHRHLLARGICTGLTQIKHREEIKRALIAVPLAGEPAGYYRPYGDGVARRVAIHRARWH